MTTPARVEMSIADLLAWASSETRLANALEDNSTEFAILAGNNLAETIALHRARSRWLDELVALKLEEIERREQDKNE